ncbi:hypothetical protein ACVWZW_001895 [Bradyrhizobium sp. F1.13.4]
MLYRFQLRGLLLRLSTYASLSRIHQGPQLSNSANIEHVAALRSYVSHLVPRNRDRMTLVFSLVLGIAVMQELLQKLTPDCDARLSSVNKVLSD